MFHGNNVNNVTLQEKHQELLIYR